MLLRLMMAGAASGDPYWANVVSLLHFDGAEASTTFTDEKGKLWTPSGSAEIDTAFSQFGGSSGWFPGAASDYITTPNHADFDFGSGDFTVEAWLRLSSGSTGYGGIVVHDQIGGTRGWLMYKTSTAEGADKLAFSAWVGGTHYGLIDSAILPTGGYEHFAAVRDGGTLRLYRSGVQVASTSISGSVGAPSEPCVIGTLWGSGSPPGSTQFSGSADDLRITKGVCRYPGGASFTPPSAAFPNS